MQEIKIIPCLDIKEGRVVKGIKFANLRDARDPVEAAEAYCREGADELVFLDIFATVESRKTRMEWVKKVCDVVTVPFAVGGGIGSIEDMKILIDIGVDKVSINTAANSSLCFFTFASKLSISLNGVATVFSIKSLGIPAPAKKESEIPWKAPSNFRILSLPV